MLLSTISLVVFLGLVAYDLWPIARVSVIGVLVLLMMLLQFFVYAMDQIFVSALHIWTAGRQLMSQIVQVCGI